MSESFTEADYAQDDGEVDVHPDECAGEVTASEVELDLAPFEDEGPAAPFDRLGDE